MESPTLSLAMCCSCCRRLSSLAEAEAAGPSSRAVIDGRTRWAGARAPQPFHPDRNCECTQRWNCPLARPAMVKINSVMSNLVENAASAQKNSPDLILNALRLSLKCT